MTSQLESDLSLLAKETFTKGDIIAGLKLLEELAGIGSIYLHIGSLSLSSLTQTADLRTFFLVLGQAGIEGYTAKTEEERRQIRAAIKTIFPEPLSIIKQLTGDNVDIQNVGRMTNILGSVEDYAGFIRERLLSNPELLANLNQFTASVTGKMNEFIQSPQVTAGVDVAKNAAKAGFNKLSGFLKK